MNNGCILEKIIHDQSSTSNGIPFSGVSVCFTEDDFLGEERTQQSDTCHLENEVLSDICETTEEFKVCNICGMLVDDLSGHVDDEHGRQIRKGNYIFVIF